MSGIADDNDIPTKAWGLFEERDATGVLIAIHVIPGKDQQPHHISSDCPCNPRWTEIARGPSLWVHSAWDRREVIEEIEENL